MAFILGGLAKVAGGLIKRKLVKKAGKLIAGSAIGGTGAAGALTMLRTGSIGKALSRIPQLLPKIGGKLKKAGPVIGGIATGATIGGLVGGRGDGEGRKRRRMNPCNPRAVRRAIRRVKGARKMLMRIERALPKQRGSGRARGRWPTGKHTEIVNVD